MDAQTALDKLIEHFLGKDYYIADPVGGDQAREIIVNEICSRYPAVKEDPVDVYRRKHKKCKWCAHRIEDLKFDDKKHTIEVTYRCVAKGCAVNPELDHRRCKLFKLAKEGK